MLNNEHCFKDDPQYGQMLNTECGVGIYPKKIARKLKIESLDTTVLGFHLYLKVSSLKTISINTHQKKSIEKNFIPELKKMINAFYSELENYGLLILSCCFEGEACYACPTNKERNSIQKAIFQQHIHRTHPSITSNKMPPDHTLIIEANISSSVSKKS